MHHATRLMLGAALAAGSLTGLASAPSAAAPPAPLSGGLIPSASYIVTLEDSAGPIVGTAQALAGLVGGDVLFTYRTVLHGFAVRLPVFAAPALASNPLVRSVRPDVVVTASALQENATWGLDRSDQRDRPLDGRYSYPAEAGQGAHVYVLDTGLNPNHAEFAGRVGVGRNFVRTGLLGGVDPENWADCNGHGTHVASTAAGTTWGVAKEATVHAVRVLGCNGSGTSSGIIAGLDWVAANQQGVAVANMSLGSSGRAADLEEAARNLVDAGVSLAVAAGNSSTNACTTSPAAEPSVLTVGATAKNDSRAPFSNLGTCLDLFAPGEAITAADYRSTNGSSVLSGTSMSSPHVAGALALVRAASPGLSAGAAQAAVLDATSAGKVTGAGTGSPNRLLYVPAGGGSSAPVDAAPTAAFGSACAGLDCAFDAAASTDDQGVASYAWTFGDGDSAAGIRPTHRYDAPGTYTVRLVVTDTAGQTDAVTREVTVTGVGSTDPEPEQPPCTDCTAYSGTLGADGQAHFSSAAGFTAAGALTGFLRGPSGADFDVYLERRGCLLVFCSWSTVASATTPGSDEQVSYTAASGTYRWRVVAVSGSGSFTFWGQPR